MNDVPLETKGSTVETDRTKSTTGLVYHTKRDSGEKNEGWFSRTLQSALEKTEDMFGSLGRLVVHRPLLVMFMSLIVCGLCGIGFLNFETESRPEELWVPQNTEAVKDYRYVQDVWQAEARYSQLTLQLIQIEIRFSIGKGRGNFLFACIKLGIDYGFTT
eukprot:943881-Amorphochlora_amoeboformis.AAC.2